MNAMIRIIFPVCFTGLFLSGFSQLQEVSIIPAPANVSYQQGEFIWNEATTVRYDNASFTFSAEWFSGQIRKMYGVSLKSSKSSKNTDNQIRLITDAAVDTNGYVLQITPQAAEIRASRPRGIFYGIQSLFQIIAGAAGNRLPCLTVSDSPAFRWRGMHLDVCRHFFSKEEVKQYIDYLAMYKMNVFHWHLTDDQGWRIAVEKYPRLGEVAAWRNGTMIGPYKNQQYDTLRYGGYYTREDIKEVVKYAADRFITVVPEIEMPGHSLAALTAYPQLSCTGGPFEVARGWGVFDDVYCAGNDSVFVFIEAVLDEVMDLFPGEYIHIGGDECPRTRWKTCEKCQKRMKDEGLKDEHELQSYFIRRIEKYVNAHGKKIIGWDEILEGGLAPNAAVMSWRGVDGGVEAAHQQHYVVMTPGKPLYFDHYQNPDKEKEPHAIGGLNTLKMVYGYDPIPADVSEDEVKYIMGAQANVWTEYILNFNHVQYMALPRMAALSEALWTSRQNKNYDDFIRRLRVQVKMLDKSGINYCKLFLTEPR